MKVIGICGKIGAGKDTLAEYLVRKHGFVKINMSDLIEKEMRSQGIEEINRFDLQEFSNEVKKKYGDDIWARACIEYAKRNNFKKIVVTGIRDEAELKFFKTLENFKLICVKADREIRFKRIKKRGEAKDVLTFSDFIKQEINESKLYDLYDKFEKVADFIINNNSILINLYTAAEAILKELGW